MKVGFIGFGRMGSALAEGAVAAGELKARQILVYDPDPSARKKVLSMKARAAKKISGLVDESDYVFLCVKPQLMEDVLQAVSAARAEKSGKGPCFVSIAAGIPIRRIEQRLGKRTAVLRVMPNTPALLQAGMSAVSRGKSATPAQEKWVKSILGSVGEVVGVPEKFMDAVTAVSGSGPAYVFYLAEAIIDGARALGLKRNLARQLVHQTIFGGGLMLKERPEPAEELRRQVTSPGGTTAAAIKEFENERFKGIVRSAVQKAARRSKELAEGRT